VNGSEALVELVVLLLLFAGVPGLLAGAGQAQAMEVSDLDAPVAPGAKTSYRQLVRKVFVGAESRGKKELEVTQVKLLRRPGTKERATVEGGMLLTGFDARWVGGDGRRNLLLSFSAVDAETKDGADSDNPFVVMVVPEGMSEPQDVADLKRDRFMWMGDALLPIGPDDAFFVSAAHHNSGQGYLMESLYHIREGRLRGIGESFTLSVDGGCRNMFRESSVWRTEPVAGSTYPRIVLTVTRRIGPGDEDRRDCGTKAKSQIEAYSGSWLWDAARKSYAAEKVDELRKLDAINEKNL
jgi:hypothetical protein